MQLMQQTNKCNNYRQFDSHMIYHMTVKLWQSVPVYSYLIIACSSKCFVHTCAYILLSSIHMKISTPSILCPPVSAVWLCLSGSQSCVCNIHHSQSDHIYFLLSAIYVWKPVYLGGNLLTLDKELWKCSKLLINTQNEAPNTNLWFFQAAWGLDFNISSDQKLLPSLGKFSICT